LWLKRKELSRAEIVLTVIAGLAVAGGVYGEYLFGSKASEAAMKLSSRSEEQVAATKQKASEADERAKRVDGENKQLGIDLAKERQKTARFQKEADIARLALQKEVTTQGPRWRLIKDSTAELVKQLSPFAGQRISAYICGPRFSVDGETISTWGSLADILWGNAGANWKPEHDLTFWDKCAPLQGIQVIVGAISSKGTREAAEALSMGLLKTLPPSSNKMPYVVDWDLAFINSLVAKGFLDKDGPERLVVSDPNLVVVLIGSHPQQ